MIVLPDRIRNAIARHAEETYPDECVGLILGRIDGARTEVEDVFAAPNRWTPEAGLTPADAEHSLRDRFYLDPRDYLRAERAARERGLDVVGCYHSHPDHPAVPSPRDLTGAQGIGGGSHFAFLIQSVREGRAAELTAWTLDDDGARFVSEETVRCPP
ncbi:MAG: M67 family metallopeptidase [Roseiflexaceae bacterium]|nr:M67 family metallopeptidase [Roseiflexus sp.]MDW8214048.1 M67 family metallopeptidase [Roseiflexaceae bacterium]